MRLALAIHSGKLAPSAVLARINSQSSRDPFSLALQELGNVVRCRRLPIRRRRYTKCACTELRSTRKIYRRRRRSEPHALRGHLT